MLGALLTLWVAGRAAVWESPLAAPPEALSPTLVAAAGPVEAIAIGADRPGIPFETGLAQASPVAGLTAPPDLARAHMQPAAAQAPTSRLDPSVAAAHQRLLAAAMRATFRPASYSETAPGARFRILAEKQAPPFAPPAAPARTARGADRTGRWSLDAWGFWREGSDAAPISQGRVPIYGASQVGANLQWRARPSSRRDPRLHARAYRALVERGENELALGASARPLPGVPVRVAGELRVTDGAFETELRPSAFAVTEFAPVRLPYGLALEAYAQGGYVGGEAATGFADGQIALTREVAAFDAAFFGRPRVSIGGGAWGGAQEGAHRVDVGPTLRLDVVLGRVPARISVDWREQVAGDAAPASGVAATLSTRF